MKYLIIILVMIPSLLFCQTWERTYGNEGNNEGYSIQQTIDGGYIITGYTQFLGNGEFDVYLIKTNDYGDTLWTKAYGGDENDGGSSVQQTTDEGYIVTGYTDIGNNYDVFLIKTDEHGDTLWTKTFGGDNTDIGKSVQQTTDGGYIITGYTSSFGNGETDVYLIKTDENGNTLWEKTYGGEEYDGGNSVKQTSDDGYIITGYINLFPGELHFIYLIKTDEQGDTLWTRSFGGYGSEGNSIQQTTDGGYILTGNSMLAGSPFQCVYLLKTNSNGDTLWTKTYGGEFGSGHGYSVYPTNDGGYIVTGVIDSDGSTTEVYLVKTNENGDTLWTKTFAYNGKIYNTGFSVQQTTDGGYIITGSTIGESEMDIYVIKTDANGIVTSTIEIPAPKPNRKLIKTIDLSGKEISKPIRNQPYLEIYNDGSIEKKLKME